MLNINKNIIMQAGAAVANATNKAAGLSASTPEPGSIISAIQLVNGGRTIGPDALAHFTESVRNKLLSLLVSMNPIQSGSGTPSPDNVRPISGLTGLSVYDDPKYGGTVVVWNQLWGQGNLNATQNGITITSDSTTGIVTITVSESVTGFAQTGFPHDFTSGHKYALLSDKPFVSGIEFYSPKLNYPVNGNYPSPRNQATISNVSSPGSGWLYIFAGQNTPQGTYQYKLQVVDLTLLFGSTVADYIYNLENATAGAGVAYFRNLFPKDYYPYNAGEQTCISAVNGDPSWKKDIDWTTEAGTVYAGSVDIVTGDIKAAPYYASYNGETLVGPWVSSMDVYDPEGTPTTGAQVVDLGGAMTDYHITGQDIITLVGDNCIWSDSGDVTIIE